MKKCSKCQREKPLDQFVSNQKYRDGLFCWCKPCLRTYQRGRPRKPKSGPRLNKGRCKTRHRIREYTRRQWKSGKIEKGRCALHNSHCDGTLCFHHNDYNKPDDVVVLCEAHHTAWHRVFLATPPESEGSTRRSV